MDKSSVAALRVSHFGKILSNFAILGAALCLASAAYFLLLAIYYMVLLVVLLGSCFLILVYHPEFMQLFSSTESINDFVAALTAKYIPIIAPITLVIAALSITLLAISKQRNIVRIVFASICLAVAIIATVIFTVLGGVK